MYHNILIVCLGNICRSPTAERIMQKKLPGHRISSAGIKALAGKDADFQAIKTALKHGVIVAGHTARQLTAPMCEQADLVKSTWWPTSIRRHAAKPCCLPNGCLKKPYLTHTNKAVKCLKPFLNSSMLPQTLGKPN